MGFEIVEYLVFLTREEVIRLIIDNEKVETVTIDGEKVVLMGSGTHKKVTDHINGGFNHVFYTSVDFTAHDQYSWCTVTLTTKDNLAFTGHITHNRGSEI